MTREEIKQTYSMKDILVKCGLPGPNRAGFIKCPFHKGDHEASMKVYDKDFHCFGCGANGDIFTFTERFYGISFKDAFLMLGGIRKESVLPIFSGDISGKKRKADERKTGSKDAGQVQIKQRSDFCIPGIFKQSRAAVRRMV